MGEGGRRGRNASDGGGAETPPATSDIPLYHNVVHSYELLTALTASCFNRTEHNSRVRMENNDDPSVSIKIYLLPF